MKKIKAAVVILLIIACSPAKAQSISKVELSIDSSTLAGKCPHDVKFKAELASTGHLKKADLKWERSDGTLVSVKGVSLSGTGKDMLTYNWHVSSAFSGNLTLLVSTESNYTGSNKISFTVTCK